MNCWQLQTTYDNWDNGAVLNHNKLLDINQFHRNAVLANYSVHVIMDVFWPEPKPDSIFVSLIRKDFPKLNWDKWNRETTS